MSKIAMSVVGLILAAAGFGLGLSFSNTSLSLLPPAPRSAETAAVDVERVGEIRGVLMEPNPFARVENLAALLGRLDEGDVQSVADAVARGAVGMAGAETDLLIRFWAAYEPWKSLVWAWRDAPDGVRSVAVDAAVTTIALGNPELAASFLTKQENLSQFDADIGREALVRGWLLSGKPGVEDYLRAMPHGIEQQRALKGLSLAIIQRDGPEGLVKWLAELEDRGHMFKTSAYRKAAPALVIADPNFAARWCEDVCDGPFGEYVRSIVAKHWAIKDGAAAMAWVASTPEGGERDRAVNAAFMRWQLHQPEELMAFIDAMDPDNIAPWFRPAIDNVATWKSWDWPLEAYEWAAQLEDGDYRELTFITISRRFLEADETAAEAWLEQSWLSEEAKEKARTFPPRYKGRGERPYPPPPKDA